MSGGFRRAAPLLLLLATACDATETPLGPVAVTTPAARSEADEVRALAAVRGITALARPEPVRPALVDLGRALLFDPILSGNRDIACATCHAPAFAMGDSHRIALGQGASGLGPLRSHPQNRFVPRNTPPLFNLHALESFLWDGAGATGERAVIHGVRGALVPADMVRVFEFGALSVIGLFPVVNRVEMRADEGNELAAVPDGQDQRVWRALMKRLGAIAEYRALFEAAYPGMRFERMSFAHASNAMAGFLIDQLAFTDSPWDRFLAGDDAALDPLELQGARTFMEIRCSICHGGPAFTDNAFHNVALAQFGPGMGDGPDRNDDFGRARITGTAQDRYAFRTTPLRNVELTGPYGHAGQFTDLAAFIDHYSESDAKLRAYDVLQLEEPLRQSLLQNADAILATRDTLLDGVVLPPEAVAALTAYLLALTDPAARDLSHLVPSRVPSGLPVPVP
jgi:cytochrome c peroxidase